MLIKPLGDSGLLNEPHTSPEGVQYCTPASQLRGGVGLRFYSGSLYLGDGNGRRTGREREIEGEGGCFGDGRESRRTVQTRDFFGTSPVRSRRLNEAELEPVDVLMPLLVSMFHLTFTMPNSSILASQVPKHIPIALIPSR